MINGNEIVSISFLTASSCNLDCSFCYLHKNQSFKNFDRIILKAWDNGSYIKNVKKSLRRLDADIEKIINIDFWGGETLMFINHITPHIPTLLTEFPKVRELKISTNWTLDVEDFIKFIKELDKEIDHKIDVRIQMSIDGPPGPIMETGHNGDWNKYYENIDKFIKEFNNYPLKNVYIRFHINSVIKKDIYFESFSSEEKMQQYVDYMKNFIDHIRQQCISKHLNCGQNFIFPQLALPYTETTEDGRKLADIIKIWETLRFRYSEDNYDDQFFHGMSNLEAPAWLLKENIECGELSAALTFLPDGSIVQCSSSYMDHTEEYQNELLQNKEFEELKKAKRLNNFHFNPRIMSEEELEDLKWYMFNGNKNNVATYIHIMMITADELAQAGQIPYYFHKDPNYLWKLLVTLSNTNTCMRENIRDTGNVFIPNISLYRRLLNGVMQHIYKVTQVSYEQSITE